METPPASQVMAAILTVLRALSDERQMPVEEPAIAARVHLPSKVVRYHLVSMERLGLVRRAGGRGRHAGWLLADRQ